MIARLRGAGFTLSETAALLSPSGHADDGWRAAGKAAAHRLRREIAERTAILTRIETLSRCACRDPVACRDAQTA